MSLVLTVSIYTSSHSCSLVFVLFSLQENLPKLYACLNVSREGPIWEETVESWRPGFVTVSHPPVRRVIVYTPGQEACDFSGLFVANSSARIRKLSAGRLP